MTRAGAYIAGDWGSSHLRLFLCASDGAVLAQCEGPGVSHLTSDPSAFAHTISALSAPWVRSGGGLAVWLAGMIGSRNGWREAPYVHCPADAASVAAAMLTFSNDGQPIWIAPGIECVNPRGAPDVMRGEETQLIGALALHPELAHDRHVLALPGTHTKWAVASDGRINTFQTSFTGELYALLNAHSILTRVRVPIGSEPQPALEHTAFHQGLARARNLRTAPLAHLLFEVRSRQLSGEMSQAQAYGFLSGLLIGQDVMGALELFETELARSPSVPLIGAARLSELYRLALAAHGVRSMLIDASDATLSGLRVLALHVEVAEASHARGA